jgi:hypothetical protein
MVKDRFSHLSILPTGSLNPKNLAADSLITKAAESVANLREK